MKRLIIPLALAVALAGAGAGQPRVAAAGTLINDTKTCAWVTVDALRRGWENEKTQIAHPGTRWSFTDPTGAHNLKLRVQVWEHPNGKGKWMYDREIPSGKSIGVWALTNEGGRYIMTDSHGIRI
jgi:hypothetical protein